jgi:phospholipase C
MIRQVSAVSLIALLVLTGCTGYSPTTNPGLLTANPNLNIANNNPGQDYGPNGNGATNPFQLDHAQAATNDQDHSYQPEQLAFDDGKDLFPYSVGASDAGEGVGTVNKVAGGLAAATDAPAIANTDGLTMSYFDGNTVTALWNYALNDQSFGTTFSASTQGAINLISGQTNGAVPTGTGSGDVVADGTSDGLYTDIGDGDPTGDVCSSPSGSIAMTNGGKTLAIC